MNKFLFIGGLMLATATINAQTVTNSWTAGTDLTATLTSDSVMTISGTGTIMSTRASAAAQPWAASRDSVKKVVFEAPVRTIGDYSFSTFNNLEEVIFPDTLNIIGYYCFERTPALGTITLPNKMRNIQQRAFFMSNMSCTSLPDSLTAIGNYAFSESRITGVINLSERVTIGDYAFSRCPALTAINVASDHPNFSSADGVLFNKTQETLITYPAGKPMVSYTVPNTVTNLPASAFAAANSLESIEIPATTTNINVGFCRYSTSVKTINVAADNPNYSSIDGVFCNKAQDTLIYYPGGKEGEYTVPGSIRNIGRYAFSYSAGLTSVNTGDSVRTIGDFAFAYINSLTSATLGSGVTELGSNNVFGQSNNLMSLTSLNPVPPTATGSTFVYAPVSAICLTVPTTAAVAAYRTALGWQAFTCIRTVADQNLIGSLLDSIAGLNSQLADCEINGDLLQDSIVVLLQLLDDCGEASISEPAAANQLRAYPNPVTDVLNINGSDIRKGDAVLLYDMQGRCVYAARVNTSAGTLSVDMSGLPTGSYILRVGERVAKVVKR